MNIDVMSKPHSATLRLAPCAIRTRIRSGVAYNYVYLNKTRGLVSRLSTRIRKARKKFAYFRRNKDTVNQAPLVQKLVYCSDRAPVSKPEFGQSGKEVDWRPERLETIPYEKHIESEIESRPAVSPDFEKRPGNYEEHREENLPNLITISQLLSELRVRMNSHSLFLRSKKYRREED